MRFLTKILKSPSLHTLGVFAGGSFLISALGGLGGIIQSRWIAPEVFGEFRKYGILAGYFNIGLVIVQDALMRQYPYLIGKGNKEEALKVASAAKWWYLTLSWLFSVVFIALTGLSLFRGDLRASVGWGVQIVVVWTSFYGVYLGIMYRTTQDFKRLTYNNLLSTIFGFFLLVLVKLWGYWGVALRNGLQLLTGLWLNRAHVPVRVKSSFDGDRLKELAKISLPISVPGYISTSLTTATLSFVILKFLGQGELGIYGVSLTLQLMAMTITSSLSQIYYPKIMHNFGESEDFLNCVKYALKPTCLNLIVSVGLVSVLYFVIDPFIRMGIPKYVAAIPVFRILSLSIILTAAALPFIVFISALKYRVIIALSIVRFVSAFGFVFLLPKTLSMIMWSMILGELCYVCSGYGFILNEMRTKGLTAERVRI